MNVSEQVYWQGAKSVSTADERRPRLYSERQRNAARAGQPEIYIYDELPQPFRWQIIYVWRDALPYHPYEITNPVNVLWNTVEDVYIREKGIDSINQKARGNRYEEYLLHAGTTDALDLIEVTFMVIHFMIGGMDEYKRNSNGIRLGPDEAIAEINRRFRQHDLGYQIVDGLLVRADNEYLHREAMLPALALLHDSRFAGAEEEFRRAHRHYRNQRNKEAIVEAAKAFESTMKAICTELAIPVSGNETAKALIDLMLKNNVIPQYIQTEFAGLRQVLESGLPTVRNKTSGHGQGAQPVEVPDYIAAYALNTAAVNIKLLVDAFGQMS
jgi:hypothetical protein